MYVCEHCTYLRTYMSTFHIRIYIRMYKSLLLNQMITYVCMYNYQIDDSATKSFLGFIVAAFSFGQLLTSPLIGAWSNYRPIKEPLIITLIISISGNLFYSYAEAFDNDGKWVLVFSRFVMGLGSGVWLYICIHTYMYIHWYII